MDADGGHPRRLTFHGALSQVVGWDGDDVVYASNAEWPFANDSRLWVVPADGGPPRLLPWGSARSVAFQPNGPGKVLGRHTADPARWKRYRGGRVGTLWPPVKPYWRQLLRRARQHGLDDAGRPDLFAERHFSDYVKH